MSKLASTLREKRKNSGLSVAEVLEKLNSAGISISDKTLYNWETGSRKPNADEFFQLCLIYGVKSFSEFKEENEKSPAPEGTEDEHYMKVVSTLTSFLQNMGWLQDGDISDDDRRFILSVAAMLNTYFEKRG